MGIERGRWFLVALTMFRLVLPLAVLASAGSSFAGLPRYPYDPLGGDAYGFYAAMRAILIAWQQHAIVLLPACAGVALAGGLCWWALRENRNRDAARIGVLSWAFGIVGALLAYFIGYTGAATIGWSLIWSVPLLPYRALGLPLDADIAFAVGLPICVAATGVTTLFTYLIGARAARSGAVGLMAATAFAVWPVVALAIGGHRGTLNGTWQGSIGLTLYTEPISTALVAGAVVLLLPKPGTAQASLAGALLGLSITLRLSNVLVLICAAGVLALRRCWEPLAWMSVSSAAFAPIVIAFWPKGYASIPAPIFPAHPFALRYAHHAWSDSLLWHPAVLVWLVPLAAFGVLVVDRWSGALLSSIVGTTAGFYTIYALTPLHPRFLFVLLPIVFVLWSAGCAQILRLVAYWIRVRPIERRSTRFRTFR